jgi:hypothetical protein
MRTEKPFVMVRPSGAMHAVLGTTAELCSGDGCCGQGPCGDGCCEQGPWHFHASLLWHSTLADISLRTDFDECQSCAPATVHDKANMGKAVRYYLRFDDDVVRALMCTLVLSLSWCC